jgi:hypothetical protein
MPTNQLPRCPFEHIPNPDLEAQQIAEVTELTVKLLEKRYPPPCQMQRAAHPKSHGCVEATFTINSDIPLELQVGLFAKPYKHFNAIIRFSNAAVLDGPDTNEQGEHGSRGMAIKVLDVGGEVLLDDNGAFNQDFLMIDQPVFVFANTEDYLRLNKILTEWGDDHASLFFAPDPTVSEQQKQRIAKSLEILGKIQGTDVGNPLGIHYFSAAPYLYGTDRVMKFSAKPLSKVLPTQPPNPPSRDYLRDALEASLQKNDIYQFDFRVQLRDRFEDSDLDIENASCEWDEQRYPFVSVATITISAPQTDMNSAKHKAYGESLAFNPWHAMVEHQPIGSINRLRKSVYAASAQHRLASETKPLPFVIEGLEKLFKGMFS